MGFFSFLFVWYNAIFTIPLLVFFFLLILQVIGFGLQNFLDLDIEISEDGTSLSDVAFFSNVLTFFHAGKVPVGILILTFMGLFGMIGLMFNRLAYPWLEKFTPGFLVISIPVALAGGTLATKVVSSLMAKLMPSWESSGESKAELRGKVGTVISAKVDEKGGRSHVKDSYGNLISVFCEMLENEEAVEEGGKVLLVQYDKGRDVYLCSPVEE